MRALKFGRYGDKLFNEKQFELIGFYTGFEVALPLLRSLRSVNVGKLIEFTSPDKVSINEAKNAPVALSYLIERDGITY